MPSWSTCIACPRGRNCLGSLSASLLKTQNRSLCLFPGEHGIVSAVRSPPPPTTWRWGWDQSKEKPERVPDLFPKDSFLPKPWGCFLPLKVQFLSVRRKHWATRDRANLNGEVGTTLQDRCLTLRTSWLSLWRRIVSYLIRGSTSGSLNRLVRGFPTSEALRGIETQSKRETDAGLLGPGFLWEAGIKSCLQW